MSFEPNREKVEMMQSRSRKVACEHRATRAAGLFMSVSILGLLAVGFDVASARADNAPSLPTFSLDGAPETAEAAKAVNEGPDKDSSKIGAISVQKGSSAPTAASLPSPAVREVAADQGSQLAAEVPAAEIGAAPEWLDSDVGPIASRPVVPGAEPQSNMATASDAETKATSTPVAASEAVDSVTGLVGSAGPAVGQDSDQARTDRGIAVPETAIAMPVPSEESAAEPALPPDVVDDAVMSKLFQATTDDVSVDDRPKAPEAVVALDGGRGEKPTAPVSQSAKPFVPKVVSIKADFSDGSSKAARNAEMPADVASIAASESEAAVLQNQVARARESAPTKVNQGRGDFVLLWIDGDQRSGDTLVKFYQPAKLRFSSGRECLEWARGEATAGRAPNPAGVQPDDLSAGCFGEGSKVGEYWLWRQRSGAFVKSTLSDEQADLYRKVAMRWTVASGDLYTTFPDVPIAGRQ